MYSTSTCISQVDNCTCCVPKTIQTLHTCTVHVCIT